MRSFMLSVDTNLPNIKDQDFIKDVLDERARLFTKAKELKVLAMARVKEKMGKAKPWLFRTKSVAGF